MPVKICNLATILHSIQSQSIYSDILHCCGDQPLAGNLAMILHSIQSQSVYSDTLHHYGDQPLALIVKKRVYHK